MKKLPLIAFIFLCFGCWNYDNCESPDCERSTEFRFNLLDASGIDIIFDDSYEYESSDISILDSHGIKYNILATGVSSEDILVVKLDGHNLQYDLLLDGKKLDSFIVDFSETQEECCGQTFWIEEVAFNTLKINPPLPRIGSRHIIIE